MRLLPIHILIASTLTLAASPSMSISYAPTKVISPGMQVVDVAGQPVGTVQAVQGTELIVRTDRHEVRLPSSSFTPDKGKLVFGMSREGLNRATDALLAKPLLPGTEVRGMNGALAGRVEAIDEHYVTIKLQSGQSIRLPSAAVGPGSSGAVLGITVAELNQMVSKTANPTP